MQIFACVLAIFGLSINLTLVSYFLKCERHRFTSKLFFILAVSDSVNCIVCPWSLYYVITYQETFILTLHNIHSSKLNLILHHVQHLMSIVGYMLTANVVMLITVLRYISARFPFYHIGKNINVFGMMFSFCIDAVLISFYSYTGRTRPLLAVWFLISSIFLIVMVTFTLLLYHAIYNSNNQILESSQKNKTEPVRSPRGGRSTGLSGKPQ